MRKAPCGVVRGRSRSSLPASLRRYLPNSIGVGPGPSAPLARDDKHSVIVALQRGLQDIVEFIGLGVESSGSLARVNEHSTIAAASQKTQDTLLDFAGASGRCVLPSTKTASGLACGLQDYENIEIVNHSLCRPTAGTLCSDAIGANNAVPPGRHPSVRCASDASAKKVPEEVSLEVWRRLSELAVQGQEWCVQHHFSGLGGIPFIQVSSENIAPPLSSLVTQAIPVNNLITSLTDERARFSVYIPIVYITVLSTRSASAVRYHTFSDSSRRLKDAAIGDCGRPVLDKYDGPVLLTESPWFPSSLESMDTPPKPPPSVRGFSPAIIPPESNFELPDEVHDVRALPAPKRVKSKADPEVKDGSGRKRKRSPEESATGSGGGANVVRSVEPSWQKYRVPSETYSATAAGPHPPSFKWGPHQPALEQNDAKAEPRPHPRLPQLCHQRFGPGYQAGCLSAKG
ncbi:hypothetical protein HDK64DRAFT_255538 [Phyllosticta capitalensis]|uniref:Uncharacterized protein n=1 Tax=Phyllosticta capitalensis TaxID=121624 RepID=A0ABR1YIA6_9PEZI